MFLYVCMFSFLEAYIYLDISKFYFLFVTTHSITMMHFLSNQLDSLYNKHVHTDNKLDYLLGGILYFLLVSLNYSNV